VRISYAQMLHRARRVGQALLDHGLSAERPLAILSGNDLEHLTLALGAMWAGVPYVRRVHGLLAGVAGLRQAAPHPGHVLTPGLVFAATPPTRGPSPPWCRPTCRWC
jgi:feruloyl-CoA synthase